MRIKVKINGRVYERTAKEFRFHNGGSIHYITVNRVPYIIETTNGQPSGVVSFDAFAAHYFGGKEV